MLNRKNVWRLGLLAALTGLVVVSTGCAKRVTQAPPTTENVPPQSTPPSTPKSTENPSDTTPTPPVATPQHGLTASDLQPVFFDVDSYSLRDDARSTLDANARLLRDNAAAKIVLEGHCDERGTVEYNQALGERRAHSVRDYLVQAGIAESRVQVISYGNERPFDPGHDEAAWAKNRRAHFTLQ